MVVDVVVRYEGCEVAVVCWPCATEGRDEILRCEDAVTFQWRRSREDDRGKRQFSW